MFRRKATTNNSLQFSSPVFSTTYAVFLNWRVCRGRIVAELESSIHDFETSLKPWMFMAVRALQVFIQHCNERWQSIVSQNVNNTANRFCRISMGKVWVLSPSLYLLRFEKCQNCDFFRAELTVSILCLRFGASRIPSGLFVCLNFLSVFRDPQRFFGYCFRHGRTEVFWNYFDILS